MRKAGKLQYIGHIGTDHYAFCREDTARQGDIVGGPKRVNNKSKMADGGHLGHKQTGVSRPLLD